MSGLVQGGGGGGGKQWGWGLGSNMPLQKSHAAISVISHYWIWLNECLNAGVWSWLVWVGGEAVVMEQIAGCLHRKVSGRFKLTNFGGAPLPHLGPIFFILMQLSGNFCQKKIGGWPLGVSPHSGKSRIHRWKSFSHFSYYWIWWNE